MAVSKRLIMKKTTKNNKTVKALLRPYTGRVICLCLLTVLYSLFLVSGAVLTRGVIDAALENPQQLFSYATALIGNMVAIVVTYVAQNWLAGNTNDLAMAHLRRNLLSSAINSSEGYLQAYHSGSLLSRGMEDVKTLCEGWIMVLPSMVGQVTRLAASMVAVLMLYSPIAIVILLAAAVVAAAAASVRPALRKQHKWVRSKEEMEMAAMQESLQQLELVQSLGAQEQMMDRFQRRLRATMKAKFHRRRWIMGINTVITGTMQIGTGALLVWGAVRIAAGDLSYGALTAMLQLLNLLRGPVVGLSGQWTKLSAIDVAAERLDVLLEQQVPQAENIQVDAIQAVVFENVSFTYPGDEAPVISDFSAEFPLNDWSCLVGVSGKGKTTLFKLMLGLYTPQAGRVYLRTASGDVGCSQGTRHLFAYVPQDFALLSGTILDNLLLVAPNADQQQREMALHLAVADFVQELGAGEQTAVRENNDGLSKGQLQRLAVARAILMDRPIFLLDECTSALDAQTEAVLLENLNTLGKCGILVTHRPEAVNRLSNVHMVAMEK